MRQRLLLFFSLLCTVCAAQQKPVSVIFDSDMGPDYDDVGAIAMLHAFADSGQANILATIACTNYEGVANVFNVLNTYFGRPQIPIAVPKGKAVSTKDWQHWTDTLLANYPHTAMRNADAPGATELYRKLLASQPDGSVTIITVGFFTNLAALLNSTADEHSRLSGKALVKRKVARVVSMAGRFPSGTEFNIEEDAAAAKIVFDNWPTEIICSGFEIGMKIKSGLPLIANEAIQNSPVKDVFRISIPMAKEDSAGRMSWDQTAVLIGIKGTAPFYKTQRGTVSVDAKGNNAWRAGNGRHYYVSEAVPVDDVQQFINKRMMHQPAAGPSR